MKKRILIVLLFSIMFLLTSCSIIPQKGTYGYYDKGVLYKDYLGIEIEAPVRHNDNLDNKTTIKVIFSNNYHDSFRFSICGASLYHIKEGSGWASLNPSFDVTVTLDSHTKYEYEFDFYEDIDIFANYELALNIDHTLVHFYLKNSYDN